ncbi:predicted protein [Sclerotinia sclerotiorum 1980 UF-70]|uniref:Uncharacterized protein n=1 Tax=Sclerotinia sclerotiorum (strain ATCC 18683 / 1980 / Ss-1) TaxID=665079 RepID=A7EXC1_SCLS1|nr:predicted protein [Sclerotinia sclerotiorum 1980 UF-70]EDN94113.1 predicted protein [Sclerotinia sclerotiorum 1980 UF-70]
MHQPSSLLTVAFLLLPLSTLVSAGLDSGSQNGSGNQNGNINPNANGNGNANANQTQNENKNKNKNENDNYNYNYNQNNNYNTNFNFNWNDNDDNNINANANDNKDKGKNRGGSPHVVYTTEIVAALTTYCLSATEIEQNGVTYTVTEASTLTFTDCPCTQTRALPGLILTPAILPQPQTPSKTTPLTNPSPNPTNLALLPLSSPSPPPLLPPRIYAPSSIFPHKQC